MRALNCAGLPGEPCSATFVAEVGFVPPFDYICELEGEKFLLSDEQIENQARCSYCAREFPKKVGVEKMHRLPAALTVMSRWREEEALRLERERKEIAQKRRAAKIAVERTRKETLHKAGFASLGERLHLARQRQVETAFAPDQEKEAEDKRRAQVRAANEKRLAKVQASFARIDAAQSSV